MARWRDGEMARWRDGETDESPGFRVLASDHWPVAPYPGICVSIPKVVPTFRGLTWRSRDLPPSVVAYRPDA